MGFVQRGTDQVVHRGVDDDEVLGLARLHIDDAGDEDAGIADDHPPGSNISVQPRLCVTRLTIAA
jgi:hypothetical protein